MMKRHVAVRLRIATLPFRVRPMRADMLPASLQATIRGGRRAVSVRVTALPLARTIRAPGAGPPLRRVQLVQGRRSV